MDYHAHRLLTIQSHVSTGYVGNRAATFPLQLLGWDVDAVNTVQFSNHTGYGRFGGLRFDAEHLEQVFTAMAENYLICHNRVLTGYTPSPEALEVVETLLREQRRKNPGLVYLLDPVMGDMERGMYVNPDVLPIYRRMLPLASILCPNQFEAQKLTDITITSLDTMYHVLEKLHGTYNAPHVLLTSVDLPDMDLAKLGAASAMPDGQPAMLLVGSSRVDGDAKLHPWFIQFPSLGEYFSGVGDMFSALTLARFSASRDDLPQPASASCQDYTHEASECGTPIAQAVALAVASLQAVLSRTRAAMIALGQEQRIDPFQPSHLLPVDERVKVMRMRELRIIQSAQDILHPSVQYRPRWAPLP
ncbi:pyridoxal kinase [Malassezia vespertilionis]|uniref:pyridoxal kinase n=1 Tax=Malassezia vespertilionis TaxID=2020962 RepID=A0A2N1JBZ5_9BASI|nr:pyridoxal kinase [Malassezia vespertilionis]PKI84068.1 Bud16p [Malassezia vespertilionis]WFD07052.1 pyridoxal kinase [Malassezia vespertilionis]